jgi:hypothetical protein
VFLKTRADATTTVRVRAGLLVEDALERARH